MVLLFLLVEHRAIAQEAQGATRREPAPQSAGSAPTLDLDVLRDNSTQDCPDARRLRQALSTQSVNLPEENLHLQVQFSRRESQVIVTIQASGARRGTRVLRIPVENCGALIDPVAVALAMLIDTRASEGAENDPPEPNSSTRSASGPGASRSNEAALASTSSVTADTPGTGENNPTPAVGVGISVGPSVAIGLVPRATYGVAFEGQLRWHWASIQVQGATYAGDTVSFGGGQVHGQTRLGRLALCAERKLGGRIHGGICGAGWMGQLRTQSTGFVTNNAVTPTLWAAGSVATVTYRAHSHFDFFLEAAWLIPTAEHVFSVEGVPGEAFHSAPTAFTFGGGVWLKSL
jgi:hypothetical protein